MENYSSCASLFLTSIISISNRIRQVVCVRVWPDGVWQAILFWQNPWLSHLNVLYVNPKYTQQWKHCRHAQTPRTFSTPRCAHRPGGTVWLRRPPAPSLWTPLSPPPAPAFPVAGPRVRPVLLGYTECRQSFSASSIWIWKWDCLPPTPEMGKRNQSP